MKKTFALAFAILIAVMAVSIASAGDLTNSISTSFNDVSLTSSDNMAGSVGDVVPVKVVFTSKVNASDVRVKVWMEGYRDEVSASTARFNTLVGSTYSKKLSLQLPSDIKDTTKEFILHVSVSSAAGYDYAEEYTILMQRESYSFGIDSVDFSNEVKSGQTVPVSVVVENIGMEDMENGYVVVSIEELGIYSKGYFGDLIPVDGDDSDQTDSVQKTVYMKIPESVKTGVYELVVKVYNKDNTVTSEKLISVKSADTTQVVATVKSKDVKAGETTDFEIIVVNAGSNIKVYSIKAVSGSGIAVTAPSVFTVGPASSKTVPITVSVAKDAGKGAHTFTLEVDGQEQIFTVNVTGKSTSTGVVALTVILAIVFVVLLVVLIVLLARKDKPVEESETSYY